MSTYPRDSEFVLASDEASLLISRLRFVSNFDPDSDYNSALIC